MFIRRLFSSDFAYLMALCIELLIRHSFIVFLVIAVKDDFCVILLGNGENDAQ